MRKRHGLQKHSYDWTPVRIHRIVRGNTSRHFTCIALFPSLTTSNKVTGSPSPFCCGWPLALPRLAPRAPASERPLSAGDFRGFLVADWAKKTSRVKVHYSYIWNHPAFLYKWSINITWLQPHTHLYTQGPRDEPGWKASPEVSSLTSCSKQGQLRKSTRLLRTLSSQVHIILFISSCWGTI